MCRSKHTNTESHRQKVKVGAGEYVAVVSEVSQSVAKRLSKIYTNQKMKSLYGGCCALELLHFDTDTCSSKT